MLSVQVGGGWSTARPASARPVAAPWQATRPLLLDAAAGWGRAVERDRAAGSAWDAVPARDQLSGAQWQYTRLVDGGHAAAPWRQVPAKDAAVRGGWDHSIRPRDIRLRLIYNPSPAWKDAHVGSPVRRVDEFGRRHDAAQELRDSLYVPGPGPLVFTFGGRPYFPAIVPQVFFSFRYTSPSHRIQPVDSGVVGVRWQSARRLNLDARLPWGRARILDGPLTAIVWPGYTGPVKPLPEPPPDPTILDTYMIANTVNLVALPGREPIEARAVHIGWDADSYSWNFSAEIFTQAAMDLVRPNADGAGEVELNINGWVWVALVERYSRSRKFPGEAYSISGASRTQLLAAPYAPARTGLNTAPLTARQAAEEQLLHTGFSLEWDAEGVGPVDWTFPAGAFSYQAQTAIQVIARIAETVGAIVRPSRDSDALAVVPRYPVPPWEWDQVDAPIARIIPPAMMTDLSGEWTPQPAWNACYVSGTAHGVSMLVRRAGTAGDEPTADVFDDWLTDEAANRARGVHELSKGGNIEVVGVTIPLFPLLEDHGVGLVLPGELCRVPEESGAWVGLCLGVDINAEGTGAVRVTQQLKLERHHSWPQ